MHSTLERRQLQQKDKSFQTSPWASWMTTFIARSECDGHLQIGLQGSIDRMGCLLGCGRAKHLIPAAKKYACMSWLVEYQKRFCVVYLQISNVPRIFCWVRCQQVQKGSLCTALFMQSICRCNARWSTQLYRNIVQNKTGVDQVWKGNMENCTNTEYELFAEQTRKLLCLPSAQRI